jgi:hypothetical protein
MKEESKQILIKMRSYVESFLRLLNEMIEQNPTRERIGKIRLLLLRLDIAYDDFCFSLLPPEKAESTRPVEGKPPMGSGKEKEVG